MKVVKPGEGFFERYNRGWRVQHAECAKIYEGTDVGVDKVERERYKAWMAQRQIEIWKVKAQSTGPKATKARQALRDRGISWEVEEIEIVPPSKEQIEEWKIKARTRGRRACHARRYLAELGIKWE